MCHGQVDQFVAGRSHPCHECSDVSYRQEYSRAATQSSSWIVIFCPSSTGATGCSSTAPAPVPPLLGIGPTSPSSSLSSSAGRLNTSSCPLTSLRFFSGMSTASPSLLPSALPPKPCSVPFPFSFARSFFFCRFALFFAVFASAVSSHPRFFASNSAVSVSYKSVPTNQPPLPPHTHIDLESNFHDRSPSQTRPP